MMVLVTFLTVYYFHRQQLREMDREFYKFNTTVPKEPQPTLMTFKLDEILRVRTIEDGEKRIVFDILDDKHQKISLYPFYLYFDGSTRILVKRRGKVEEVPLHIESIRKIFSVGSEWKASLRVEHDRLTRATLEEVNVNKD